MNKLYLVVDGQDGTRFFMVDEDGLRNKMIDMSMEEEEDPVDVFATLPVEKLIERLEIAEFIVYEQGDDIELVLKDGEELEGVVEDLGKEVEEWIDVSGYDCELEKVEKMVVGYE